MNVADSHNAADTASSYSSPRPRHSGALFKGLVLADYALSFYFGLTLFLAWALLGIDHWVVFAIAWTPLPSLLFPVACGVFLLTLIFRRSKWPWAAGSLLIALIVVPFELGTLGALAGPDEPGEIRILSANLGQRDRESLRDFVETVQPDVIATQAGRFELEAGPNSTHHQVELGQFTVWSRWPIQSADSIFEGGHHEAARFEIDGPGGSIAVYVLHLPTPRFVLAALRGRGILHAESRQAARQYQQRKWEQLENLTSALAQETLPFIVVGDANQPAVGPAYRQLTMGLRDGHRAAGRGFGYTIPGIVNTPALRPLCPWARVDYILAGEDWQFLEHRTEPWHPGQHLAVFARLRRQSYAPE